MFILKPTGSHYKHVWGDNDYVVLESGQVVGRIMLHSQAPEGRPWFWTITALEQPRSVYNHGYSASRE